ncbi:MAG: FHA domain-containing protein [Rhizonema sp. NSF051]|nr:FHA domain-containing protein [Rhizonema sp. NSF051]
MQNTGESQKTRGNLELFHVQTKTSIELPLNVAVIRIGKPKDKFIPEVNVSNFPNANFVSRLHAEILLEESCYYIVDLGSANGTYVNNMRLEPKKRHPLNLGDQIDLTNGSKVTFLFLEKEIVVYESDTILNYPPTVLQIELVANMEQTPQERFSNLVYLVRKILSDSLQSLKELLRR